MQSIGAAALAALLLFSSAAQADTTVKRSMDLGTGSNLVLQLPEGWQHEVRRAGDGTPPTLLLMPAAGEKFQVLVTVFPLEKKTPTMRKLVETAATSAKATSVESTLTIETLGGTNGGHYFRATDKAPKPGEFKLMTQGATLIDGRAVTFTILTNDGQKAVVDSALAALREAKLTQGGTVLPVFVAEGRVHLPIPGLDWEISFQQDDWTLQNSRQRTDGRGYYVHYASAGKGLNVSFYVDLADQCKTSEDCREHFWKNAGPGYGKATDLKRFVVNGFAVLQSTVPIPDAGFRMQQLNYSAHLVRDGRWIDLHMSTTGKGTLDPAPLQQFLESVKVAAR